MKRKTSKKTKTTSNQIMKRKVRASQEWKDLRAQIKAEQKVDPITLQPLQPSFNLHHLDDRVEHYGDLDDKTRYCGVNSWSHELLHGIFRIYKREGDFDVLERIKYWVLEMERKSND